MEMVLKRITNIAKRYKYRKCLPADPKASDLYLVEFPKSGITWLSTIMANLVLIHGNVSQRATFYNVSQYIPDIHMTGRYVGESAYTSLKIRIVKSHSEYNPYYLHSVYLVRHPEAVMRSYYTFLAQHGINFKNIDQFIEDDKYGISAWKRHVNSWLGGKNQSSRLHLLRYEDMLDNIVREISDINNNIGLGFDKKTILDAAELSSIDNMKKSEELYVQRNPRYRLSFVKGNREGFSIEVKERIAYECEKELRLLGYVV